MHGGVPHKGVLDGGRVAFSLGILRIPRRAGEREKGMPEQRLQKTRAAYPTLERPLDVERAEDGLEEPVMTLAEWGAGEEPESDCWGV